jgi:two-component system, cell cycle sensor histidine kinase PleC
VSSGFFWCVDENLRFTYVSARAEDVCGLEDAAHIGWNFEDLGYSWIGATSPFDDLGAFHDRLVRRTSNDGHETWLRLGGKPLFKPPGGFSGYIGTGVATAAPLEPPAPPPIAEVTSNGHLEMFKSAMESLTDGFALFGPDGKLVFCNANFRKINENDKWPPDAVMTFEKIVQGNMRLGLLEDAVGREEAFLAERMAQHRSPTNEPKLMRWTDGNVLLVRERKLADGSIAVVNTDMTELSRRELELTGALDVAEQASRAKSAFLARMSHELRTPLNAIIGFSDLMLSEAFGPLGSDRYRVYVGDVKTSGEHLLSLINDLLDLTGIESGRREFVFESQRPRDLVSTALRAVRPIGHRAGIRLRGTAPPELPDVKVDARAMHQCLLNLLSNAIKATRRGGRVAISVSHSPAGQITFAVTDTGKGMSKPLIDRVLRNYGLVGASYVAETDGAGLGLPITRSLIDIMGGRLEVESEVGLGTRVSLIVPVA